MLKKSFIFFVIGHLLLTLIMQFYYFHFVGVLSIIVDVMYIVFFKKINIMKNKWFYIVMVFMLLQTPLYYLTEDLRNLWFTDFTPPRATLLFFFLLVPYNIIIPLLPNHYPIVKTPHNVEFPQLIGIVNLFVFRLQLFLVIPQLFIYFYLSELLTVILFVFVLVIMLIMMLLYDSYEFKKLRVIQDRLDREAIRREDSKY